MGRGADDDPLALEQPMPLPVASAEGLDGNVQMRSTLTWLCATTNEWLGLASLKGPSSGP